MSRFYFAYGSNMHQAQMAARCPDCCLLGRAVLHGFRWIITTRGYASILPDPESRVEGVLLTISAADEEALDGYEGVDRGHYRKALVRVEYAGKKVVALTYIDPIEQEGAPQPEYVQRINAALKDAGLSPAYVQGVVRRYIPAAGIPADPVAD